jgi:hypothetical protein
MHSIMVFVWHFNPSVVLWWVTCISACRHWGKPNDVKGKWGCPLTVKVHRKYGGKIPPESEMICRRLLYDLLASRSFIFYCAPETNRSKECADLYVDRPNQYHGPFEMTLSLCSPWNREHTGELGPLLEGWGFPKKFQKNSRTCQNVSQRTKIVSGTLLI